VLYADRSAAPPARRRRPQPPGKQVFAPQQHYLRMTGNLSLQYNRTGVIVYDDLRTGSIETAVQRAGRSGMMGCNPRHAIEQEDV
jgi:hypothetical protein